MAKTVFDPHAYIQEPLISTTSVHQLVSFGSFLFQQEKPATSIGLASGVHGTGKTLAARALQQQLQSMTPANEPVCWIVHVPPHWTPRAFLQVLASQVLSFSDQADFAAPEKRMTREESLAILLPLLASPEKRLLVVDEAEFLGPECYELLHYLFQQTRCPILLLGGPRLEAHVQSSLRLCSCVVLTMTFAPLTEEEVLQTFLPQIVSPGWSFDPQNECDRELGREIWDAVRPSLRCLQGLIQMASHLARNTGDAAITRDMLRQMLDLLAFPAKHAVSGHGLRGGALARKQRLCGNEPKAYVSGSNTFPKEKYRHGSL